MTIGRTRRELFTSWDITTVVSTQWSNGVCLGRGVGARGTS